MNGQDKGSESKNSVGAFAVVIFAIVMLNVISSGNGGAMVFILIAIALIIGVIFFVAKFVEKSAKDGKSANSVKFDWSKQHEWKYKDPDEAVTEKVYAPIHETAPQKQYYESSDVFDNYERDQKKRIEQLDVFLENGIIDKEEYRILKKKYQQKL